jgi:formylglycine-generating enzyme required for sulfatase activity
VAGPLLVALLVLSASPDGMVRVPAGAVVPFLKDAAPAGGGAGPTPAAVAVAAFALAATPVTNADFAAFVAAHPAWRRSRVPRLFADASYLATWASDLDPGPQNPPAAPVTRVSWFAAKAYCAARGARLPTTLEWERAAADGDAAARRATAERILAWYSTPSPAVLRDVGGTPANALGIFDLHGLIWEWTLDFNSAMAPADARGGDSQLFCGSGGVGAADPSDAATFLRWAFRSSLRASFTVSTLGFRCARDDG